jgi:fibro-slime domain-containing protein
MNRCFLGGLLAAAFVGSCASKAGTSRFEETGSGGGSTETGGGEPGGSSGTGGASSGGAFGSGGSLLGLDGSLVTGGGPGEDAANGDNCNSTLKGVIRDFKAEYPDMEVASHDPTKMYADDRGIVAMQCDADRKPVYAGDPIMGTLSTTGKANFDNWYRTVDGVNMAQVLSLPFADPDGDGVFTYDNQTFFPIDGQLFGNDGMTGSGVPHNYHFTFELHTKFVYNGGETFTFIGDDDVWVFINQKRVVDLGGVHAAETGPVILDTEAPTLGLVKGQTYPLDFFFAERHVTQSHFRLDTSLQFIDCGTIIN